MTAPHRARPEQWAAQEAFRDSDDDASCLLELLDRVLEVDACLDDIIEQLNRVQDTAETLGARLTKLGEGPIGPVPTDDELCELWDRTRGPFPDSLRAIYNLGRQHAIQRNG